MQELLGILAFAFLLGIKHAIEPDHVVAVSTIASVSKRLWRAALTGVFWGIGHTATLFAAGFALYFVKEKISENSGWAMSLEMLVGVMLVYLGVSALITFGRDIHAHKHRHGDESHSHFHFRCERGAHEHRHRASYGKSMLIGFVHGLAGSAAMALLAMSQAKTITGMLAYILVFGAGTVAGMLLCTTVVGIPFVLTAHRKRVNGWLTAATGAISAVYGLYYIYDIGVNEGLFRLWQIG